MVVVAIKGIVGSESVGKSVVHSTGVAMIRISLVVVVILSISLGFGSSLSYSTDWVIVVVTVVRRFSVVVFVVSSALNIFQHFHVVLKRFGRVVVDFQRSSFIVEKSSFSLNFVVFLHFHVV